MDIAARDAGYFQDIEPFLTDEDIDDVPDDQLLMIVTGSQGEPRSALARIAMDNHPTVALGDGDTVIFSSREIPGNERAITTVQNNLIHLGVRLLDDSEHKVHVSGHPAREELKRLYALVRPTFAIPVHGELRHLVAHAELAETAGATTLLIEDGDIVNLAPGGVEIVDSAPVGRLVLDGGRLIPIDGAVMAARRRMLFNGVVVASLAVDDSGKIKGTPRLTAPGLLEPDDAWANDIVAEISRCIADLPAAVRREDASVADAVRAVLRRQLGRKLQKRPLVDVHVMRV
jgi:ribonuclease J